MIQHAFVFKDEGGTAAGEAGGTAGESGGGNMLSPVLQP